MRKSLLFAASFFSVCLFVAAATPPQPQQKKAPLRNPRDLTAHLIGHAHIDLAWLWRWEETVHDVATHTFWGTLAQMDRLPGLTFAQSQAAVYEAIEKNYPGLFERIKDKVKSGTWIPVGGMWAEPDLNMPDGESLARQLLYGKKYFLEKFGVDVQVGWNPDSFGHNFQLPQILTKAGIKYYVFERCAPKDAPVFWWEGADGSRVLAYVPPGWYLVDLKNGVKDLLTEAAGSTGLSDFMLLYGAGDHGGGPRATDIDAIQKFRRDRDHPKLEFVHPGDYFRMLASSKSSFPVVNQELNFTFPACYTTQVEVKKHNRRLENLLLSAEKLSSLAFFPEYRNYYPERDLDEAWKTVLRNQFHDILDGSSIGPVYEEAEEHYQDAYERGKRALRFSFEAIADAIDTRGEGLPLIVFNSLAWIRTDPVETEIALSGPDKAIAIVDDQNREVPYQVLKERKDGELRFQKVCFIAESVPSLGYKTYRLLKAGARPEFKTDLSTGAYTLENRFLRASLDPRTGWLKSLIDRVTSREALASPGNILQAIVDEPKSMSAWELDLKQVVARIGENGASVEVLENGPVRAIIRVKNAFRSSLFTQDIRLYSNLPRLDCLTKINWQERNLMIKAAFPAAARNTRADFEIPYGHISRPADGTEVPALKWVDLTDESGSFGLSLLNDSRHGFDVRENMLRISLIHGATSPDPEADRGMHETVYSLYPHDQSWREGLTFRRGLELNSPLIAHIAMNHPGPLKSVGSFMRVEPENVILSSLKKESGYFSRDLVLRVFEVFGRETDAIIEVPADARTAIETDLIERPLAKMEIDGNIIRLKMKPFEIKTIKLSKEMRRLP
jgi:alpha-mannosidase